MAFLRGLAERLVESEHSAGHARIVKLDAQYELDQARRARTKASGKVDAWAAAHPIRMRANRLSGRQPRAWRDLSHDVAFWRRAVADVKRIMEVQEGAAAQATSDAERVAQTPSSCGRSHGDRHPHVYA
ncbi:hypothetical protein IM816_16535 [Luteibacter flocculans]|uniref:Uncharacterized protein n=1 Tax=Luteibacter flocculans TaxID=2780091 RepID=A0ABY4T276_9GAMM|nr:hypothetical protein [Luteibacter flocculans]URL58182.1 hypothetical protein IM816_16535 [Luteibacter flocculans]